MARRVKKIIIDRDKIGKLEMFYKPKEKEHIDIYLKDYLGIV